MAKKLGKIEHLFKPITIKGMEIRNRFVMAPMETMQTNFDGTVSEMQLKYFVARAKGGVGLIIVEGATVHPSCGLPMILGIHNDSFIPGLKKLADRVHSQGAKISIQLFHLGRQLPDLPDLSPWAPSAIPCPKNKNHPHEMTIPEIEDVIEAFGQAALRAKKAGFDSIEVHGAHGYLLQGFLSPYSNRRTDKYGGDVRSRMRMITEVTQCIREKVGSNYPILCRISAEEHIPGGRNLEETVTTTPWLVEAGADCIDISTGNYNNFLTKMIPPMEQPKGLNIYASEAIKKVVDVPVIVAGKLNDPLIAEGVLAQGKADMIAIGRQLLADAEYVNKVAAGDFEDIRWCISCNTCMEKVQTIAKSYCLVNPEMGREVDPEFAMTPTPKAKKVLVIGGGPAGMETARVAALRGHDVTLYEKNANLGGQLCIACIPPCKQELAPFIKYLTRAIDKAGVKIVTEEATGSTVDKLKPDVVVIATGGKPLIPDIPGVYGENVVTAWDVLTSKVDTGDKVLIAGGGLVGCETAEFLADYGKDVTIVEALPKLASDAVEGRDILIRKRLAELDVKSVTSTTIKSFTPDGVVITHNGQDEAIRDINTIILAMGVSPVNDLLTEVKNKVSEFYVIGDAQIPATAYEAMLAGAQTGRKI